MGMHILILININFKKYIFYIILIKKKNLKGTITFVLAGYTNGHEKMHEAFVNHLLGLVPLNYLISWN